MEKERASDYCRIPAIAGVCFCNCEVNELLSEFVEDGQEIWQAEANEICSHGYRHVYKQGYMPKDEKLPLVIESARAVSAEAYSALTAHRQKAAARALLLDDWGNVIFDEIASIISMPQEYEARSREVEYLKFHRKAEKRTAKGPLTRLGRGSPPKRKKDAVGG